MSGDDEYDKLVNTHDLECGKKGIRVDSLREGYLHMGDMDLGGFRGLN